MFIYADTDVISPLLLNVMLRGHTERYVMRTSTTKMLYHFNMLQIFIFAYNNKNSASVEHACQYEKCLKLVNEAAADRILISPTGRTAKNVADDVIKYNVADLHVWRLYRKDVMYIILRAK